MFQVVGSGSTVPRDPGDRRYTDRGTPWPSRRHTDSASGPYTAGSHPCRCPVLCVSEDEQLDLITY